MMKVVEKRSYPCDGPDGVCPYGDGNGMYFCRDNCGLGVGDNDDDSDIILDDEDLEE